MFYNTLVCAKTEISALISNHLMQAVLRVVEIRLDCLTVSQINLIYTLDNFTDCEGFGPGYVACFTGCGM